MRTQQSVLHLPIRQAAGRNPMTTDTPLFAFSLNNENSTVIIINYANTQQEMHRQTIRLSTKNPIHSQSAVVPPTTSNRRHPRPETKP